MPDLEPEEGEQTLEEYALRRGELLTLCKATLIAIASCYNVQLSERISKEQMITVIVRLVTTTSKQMHYMRDLGWKRRN